MPDTIPNFIALGQTIYEKRVTKFFLPTCEFWQPRETPWADVHQSWN